MDVSIWSEGDFFSLSHLSKEGKWAEMCQVSFRVTVLSSNPISLLLKISHRILE